MGGEWRQYDVSALINDGILLIGDGYRAKNDELAPSGLPFARAGNINNGFQFDDADHFPDANVSRVTNKISQPGDVVFTSKGTVGRFAFVRSRTPRFVYSPQLCFWRSLNTGVIESHFLYFWMYGREFFVQFKGVAGQTDMAEYVSLSDQRRMRITLPPIYEQRTIAHILGTLDDKIELNRKMSETLEAMARTLFKSWFVDFDPVRAKAAGEKPPGLADDIAALFPDRFVESELGEIPEGWSDGRLSDLVELKYGKALKATERCDGKVPVYGSGGITGWHDEALVEHPTVIVGRKGSVGTLYWEDRPSYPIDTTFFVTTKTAPLTFCYYAMLGLGLEVLNTDAAVPGLNRDNAYRQTIVIPPPDMLAAWDSFAGVLRENLRLLRDENDVLTQLRDLLLPRLISGKLRVSEAEEAIAEVMM